MFYDFIRKIILKDENAVDYKKSDYVEELYNKMKQCKEITMDMVDEYEHEVVENILDYRDYELERVFKIALLMGIEIQKELEEGEN